MLWGHLAVIMSYQDRRTLGWWKSYDVALHHSFSSMVEADFKLNQCLFTQMMVKSSEILQRPSLTVSTATTAPKAKQRKILVCFAWNDAKQCVSQRAIFPTAAPVVGEIMPEDTVLHNWKSSKQGPTVVKTTD